MLTLINVHYVQHASGNIYISNQYGVCYVFVYFELCFYAEFIILFQARPRRLQMIEVNVGGGSVMVG